MKLLFYLSVLILLWSCQCSGKKQGVAAAERRSFAGEWRLDSSAYAIFNNRLIVLEDGSCYLFSGMDGGSLLWKGKIAKDSVLTQHGTKMALGTWDSARIFIEQDRENKEIFKPVAGDARESLAKYLRQDAFRSRLVGWWKLVSRPEHPVKMINSSAQCRSFTLHIGDNGSAVFYLDNKYDSTETYTYRLNEHELLLQRYCVVSGSEVAFDAKGKMKLMLDRTFGDTLVLERLTDIK